MKRIMIGFFSLAYVFSSVFASVPNVIAQDNTAPIFAGPSNVSTDVNHEVQFVVTVNDPDGDQLSFSTDLPQGASYNAQDALFAWTPTQAGTFNARFVANDGFGDVIKEVVITVNALPENHVPVFNGPIHTTTTVGEEVSFEIGVTDQDSDPIHLTYELPEGASFANNRFTWVPTQAGTFNANFYATDGKATSTHCVTIEVSPKSEHENTLPIFAGPESVTIEVNHKIEFVVTVNDPDGDQVELTTKLPEGASYNESEGLFSWTPTQVGEYKAKFFTFDGTGTSTHKVHISVTPPNNQGGNTLPIFTGPDEATTTVFEKMQFVVTAQDPDGDDLVLTTDLPQGATYQLDNGLFEWTPTTTGDFIAKFFAFDGTGTSTHEVKISVCPRGVTSGPRDCSVNGLYGSYYNLPKNHPDIEGKITGVISTTTPAQFDWFSSQYLSFERTDALSELNKPANFFPVNEGREGDPFYFAVHWQGTAHASSTGDYQVTLGGDDDVWLYVNDQLVLALGGIHPFVSTTTTVHLEKGASKIDIYYAERHVVQAGIQFNIEGVTFSPCLETEDENHPPYFVNFNPPTMATSTHTYTYDVEAADPDNDPLSFSLPEAPEGMSIATSTGVITWIPTREQATTTPYNVLVKVSDGELFATTTYQIVVKEDTATTTDNRLPVISGPTEVTVTVESNTTFEITVSDPDGDQVTLTHELPRGASFSTTTFSWTPTSTGMYIAKFFATDGHGTSTHETHINVVPKETPPNNGGGGGGGGGGSTPPPSSGGGGGGGGNGPPTPITPSNLPVPQVVGGGGGSVPPTNPTPVPSQPIPQYEPPRQSGGNPIVVVPPSISIPTTTATSTEVAESEDNAGLFAGLFKLIDWLKDHWCIIGWLLWLLTLIAFLTYVFMNRQDDDDEDGDVHRITEIQKDPTPPLPLENVSSESNVPEGILLEDETPESSINEYWETYQQEKE